MTRSRLIALLLMIGVVLAWLAVKRERHPDTSSVAPYAPYVEIGGDIAPSWSPDGNTVVFCRFSAADAQLYKIQANGGAPTTFLADIPEGCLPDWSPDGSHIAFTSKNEFDASIQYFVDQGFVVLAPIYRGSAGFGDDLARFGEGDDMVPDVRAAVNYLKGQKAVDPTRIGAIGFSFGGYLVLRSITQSPQLFAAAVEFFGAADVVAHYQDHPAMRDRLHQLLGGTLEQNRPAYVAASPINFVERIKTPLLILHGTRDGVVSYSQSVELSKALTRARKKHEFIAYRFAGHGFSGHDDVDAKQQAMRFLLAHLQWSPTK